MLPHNLALLAELSREWADTLKRLAHAEQAALHCMVACCVAAMLDHAGTSVAPPHPLPFLPCSPMLPPHHRRTQRRCEMTSASTCPPCCPSLWRCSTRRSAPTTSRWCGGGRGRAAQGLGKPNDSMSGSLSREGLTGHLSLTPMSTSPPTSHLPASGQARAGCNPCAGPRAGGPPAAAAARAQPPHRARGQRPASGGAGAAVAA